MTSSRAACARRRLPTRLPVSHRRASGSGAADSSSPGSQAGRLAFQRVQTGRKCSARRSARHWVRSWQACIKCPKRGSTNGGRRRDRSSHSSTMRASAPGHICGKTRGWLGRPWPRGWTKRHWRCSRTLGRGRRRSRARLSFRFTGISTWRICLSVATPTWSATSKTRVWVPPWETYAVSSRSICLCRAPASISTGTARSIASALVLVVHIHHHSFLNS